MSEEQNPSVEDLKADEKEKVEEGVVVGWAQLFEIILKNK